MAKDALIVATGSHPTSVFFLLDILMARTAQPYATTLVLSQQAVLLADKSRDLEPELTMAQSNYLQKMGFASLAEWFSALCVHLDGKYCCESWWRACGGLRLRDDFSFGSLVVLLDQATLHDNIVYLLP